MRFWFAALRFAAVGIMAIWAGVASGAEEFDFSGLRHLLDEPRIESVADLVAALPEDLRRNYALVFSSRSLQEASYDNPRAILFGGTGRLIVSFNGQAGQRGYDALETMELDAATNQVRFREISFPAPGTAALVSDPNPPRCAACHGDPARPIWDLPPSWPGVYGERYGAGLSAPELRGMREFLARQASHPRYRHLIGAAALADRETYVAGSHQRYAGIAAEPPNARLSTLLATVNVRAILAQLAAQPGFAAHLDVLVAAAGGQCGSIEEFFPPQFERAVGDDYRQFETQAAAARGRALLAKEMRRAGDPRAYTAPTGPRELTELRYVAERLLDVPTQRWTLAFERGSYDLTSPPGAPTLEQGLAGFLARTDPDLMGAQSYRTFDSRDLYCERLRRGSRAALDDWYRTHGLRAAVRAVAREPAEGEASFRPPLLDQCIACHGSGAAPALPFAEPDQIAGRLRDGSYPRGRLLDEILYRLTPEAGVARMPRGLNIDATQQRELADYFIRLAGAH